MASPECGKSIPVTSELYEKFDNSGDGRLDTVELEAMALDKGNGVAADMGPFSIAVMLESPKCVADTFMSLSEAARNTIYDSVPFISKDFMPTLWRYAPKEPKRLNARGGRQESTKDIIKRVARIPDKRFSFDAPPSQFSSLLYSKIASAVAWLRSSSVHPDIMAFGEVHPHRDYAGQTAAQLFSTQVIPALADHYKDLVLEFLPCDIPRDELDYFMEHGIIDDEHTPILNSTLGLLIDDGHSTIQILDACRKHGIRVHGGGPSMAETGNFLERRPLKDNKSGVEAIRDNSQMALEKLVGSGRPTLWYGGTNHNGISGKPANASFGKSLAEKYNYLEVDLVMTDVLCDHVRRGNESGNILIPIKQHGSSMSGSNGISLVERQRNSFAMVVPGGK